jgi:GTP-binding protein Era
MVNNTKQKSSFIAVCGAPNAGKSSLVNYIVGTKVSIVSPRPQTTRVNIRGILTEGDTQLVFVDTPGIMNPHDDRQEKMVKNAWDGVNEVEAIMFVVDAEKGITDLSRAIIEKLKVRSTNIIAVVNKIDLIDRETQAKLAQELFDFGIFKELFVTSVNKSRGIEDLVNYLLKTATDQPWAYPDDQISDANDRFLAEEVTREKIFYLMREEIPYGVDVETESYKEDDKKGITIHQVIHVAKDAHKKIIIGDNADMIKKIGQNSRYELTKLLGKKVHLFLHVKVAKSSSS